MNTPAASAALIARAIAALEARGKVVAGVMATAGKAAVVLTPEGLAALAGGGAVPAAESLTVGPSAANDGEAALDAELEGWAQGHAAH